MFRSIFAVLTKPAKEQLCDMCCLSPISLEFFGFCGKTSLVCAFVHLWLSTAIQGNFSNFGELFFAHSDFETSEVKNPPIYN